MTKRLDKKDARFIKTKSHKIPERILEMLMYLFNHSEKEWKQYAGLMLCNLRTIESEISDEAFCEITGWTPAKLHRFEDGKGNILIRDLVTYAKALGLSVSIEFKNDNPQKRLEP